MKEPVQTQYPCSAHSSPRGFPSFAGAVRQEWFGHPHWPGDEPKFLGSNCQAGSFRNSVVTHLLFANSSNLNLQSLNPCQHISWNGQNHHMFVFFLPQSGSAAAQTPWLSWLRFRWAAQPLLCLLHEEPTHSSEKTTPRSSPWMTQEIWEI